MRHTLTPLLLCLIAFPALSEQTAPTASNQQATAAPQAPTVPGRSAVESSADWTYTPEHFQTVPCDDAWWAQFADHTLDSLIRLGVDNNYNVAMAAKRMAIARNTLNAARSAYYPQLDLQAGWSRSRTSGVTSRQRVSPMTEEAFDVGLSMSWEIDLFGKITSAAKAKEGLYNASRAEYAGAMVSMSAQIATTWFQLQLCREEIALAASHCVDQERVVKITEARHEAGIGNALEVAQARTVLASTRATIPALEDRANSALNALAVLVGLDPSELAPIVEAAGSAMPDYPLLSFSDASTELLRRRPDVVEAEAQLASYAAQLGVAKKDFLPTLTLNGSVGTQSRRFDRLFTGDSFTYSIAPILSWSVFDGFARKNALASARRQMEIGIDNYNLTLLTAVQETSNAVSAYCSSVKQIALLQEVVEQSRKSLDLSLNLYKQGLASFTNVVDAQIDLLQYENSLISARNSALDAVVSLYEALGGGW